MMASCLTSIHQSKAYPDGCNDPEASPTSSTHKNLAAKIDQKAIIFYKLGIHPQLPLEKITATQLWVL